MVGARFASVERGSVVIELDAHSGHQHPGGVVQGGIITAIADAAMGVSLMTLQEPEQANVTIELKINFIRPVVEGRLRAVGRVVSMKRTVLFAEADVLDADGRLVAKASSTCLAVPRKGWRKD